MIKLDKEPFKKQKYTRQQLLEYLRQFYEENGRYPNTTDFIKNTKYPSFATYQKNFGSRNRSLEIAGLLDKRINKNRVYINTELLYYLKQFYEENGRSLTRRDFNNNR